jgi:hypothetical protein
VGLTGCASRRGNIAVFGVCVIDAEWPIAVGLSCPG